MTDGASPAGAAPQGGNPQSPSVAAYCPDLMDRSKIAAAAPGCRFVARPEGLVGLAATDVVLVDLGKQGVIEVLADIVAGTSRVIAYGSHVDHSLLAAARAAGCREVLPRSKFFSRLPQLLAPPARP